MKQGRINTSEASPIFFHAVLNQPILGECTERPNKETRKDLLCERSEPENFGAISWIDFPG
jgi:hypothetical protein